MAIYAAATKAPCPLFSGRGLDQTGFTIKMREKTYLSCDPINIAQEKDCVAVYNYDLAEAVYNESEDRAVFGVYVETGAYTDQITSAKHMYAFDFFFKLSEDYQVAAGGERNADVRCGRIQIETAGSCDGVVHGVYLAARLTGGETYLGKYLEYTSSYGAIGLEVRIETIGSGTVTAGDGTNYGLAGLLVAYKGSVALDGNYHAIVLHCPYEGGAIGDSSVGIYFMNTVILAGTAFDIGIDFGDSMVVIAIDIGDVTTGIKFTGTATTGIDFQDETTTAIDIGACTTGISITGAVTDVINCSTTAWTNTFLKSHGLTFTTAINCMWFSFTDSVTSGDVTGIRMIIISSAASAGPDVRPFYGQATTAVGGYAASLTGGKFEASVANGTAVISGDIYGLEAKFSKGTTYSCANLAGIKVLIQTVGTGETITTVDTGLWIMNEAVGGNGRLMDSGIRIDSVNVTNDKGYDCLIDGSGTRTTVHDTDRVKLLKFQDDQGTTVTMSYDRGDAALKFA